MFTGNEEAAAVAITGAIRRQTVTPDNPTPPTNIACVGKKPPMPPPPVPGARQSVDGPGDPGLFAPATAGNEAEAAGTEVTDPITGTRSTNGRYIRRPNTMHPSAYPEVAEDLSVTSLDPDQAAMGGPDLTLHVHGTGFTADSVIIFNGGEEATVFVSDTELTTGVKPSLVGAPITVPVTVERWRVQAAPQMFTFTEE